jgi:hypothetical protein
VADVAVLEVKETELSAAGTTAGVKLKTLAWETITPDVFVV